MKLFEVENYDGILNLKKSLEQILKNLEKIELDAKNVDEDLTGIYINLENAKDNFENYLGNAYGMQFLKMEDK